ncbi:hypothetical protein LPJ59_006898 [Coemansia sp. RSA 2399]|nr:hypothetical protein LPJ59_006898 [Coemansia sp. RSA 2399]
MGKTSIRAAAADMHRVQLLLAGSRLRTVSKQHQRPHLARRGMSSSDATHGTKAESAAKSKSDHADDEASSRFNHGFDAGFRDGYRAGYDHGAKTMESLLQPFHRRDGDSG